MKKSRAGREKEKGTLLNLASCLRRREVFEGRGEGLQLYLSTSTGDVGGSGQSSYHLGKSTWQEVL